jgi:5-methylcytosine-specific restriction endonuclease McrA
MINFDYPEDQEFFAHLLAGGDIEKLQREYADLFDFRHPAVKRWEFDKTSKKVLQGLIEKYEGKCQLQIHPECNNDNGFDPDHIIPLSTNVLNKELRKMVGADGKKAETQSFGSNHLRNLTLACKRCNSYKKNKILLQSELGKLIW